MMVREDTVKSNQLRYYIALSAPPTRAPADGTEDFIRLEAGFNPSWFHKYCSIDFSRRWHKDPDYRLESYNIMKGEVRRRFPGLNIGQIEDDEPPDLITGMYGCAVVPVLFSQSIKFFPDKWPAPHGKPLTDDETDKLAAVEPQNNSFFQGILSQIDRIEHLTGSTRGYLNWQGVLNTAFRLRGQKAFMDLTDSPERAHHLFECIASTMIRGIKILYERQKKSGIEYTFATISNCVVNMIGPEHYTEHVLPYDRKIRDEFEQFGIHNCAWTVDPYIEAYATIPDVGYIDMGIESNLQKVKDFFPDTRRTVLYTSMDLADKSDDRIRRDFELIAKKSGPCDIGLPDIETDVPDERLFLAQNLCRELSKKYGGNQ
jgi:hypothetical protein